MRVKNPQSDGVFVKDYGIVPAGEEATVPKTDSVKQLIKDGVLREVQQSPSTNKDGDK